MKGLVAERAKSECHSFLADSPSSDTVLRRMVSELHIIGVDGQNTETRLFSPVVPSSSSVFRHQEDISILLRGDRFSSQGILWERRSEDTVSGQESSSKTFQGQKGWSAACAP